MGASWKIRVLLLLLWIGAMGAAFAVDRPVATWVHDTVPVNKKEHRTHVVLEIIKLPGWFWFTLGVAVLLLVFHKSHAWAAATLLLSGIAGGLAYVIIKWIVGRHRPVVMIDPWGFHPFAKGIRGFFGAESALSFPSGHASLSFATAMSLAMLIPRWKWAFFFVATVTCVERVIENAHYVSDVVAGAGIGMCLAFFITRAIIRLPAASQSLPA